MCPIQVYCLTLTLWKFRVPKNETDAKVSFFCLKEGNDRQISRIEKQMKNRYNGSGGVEVGNDTIIAGNESKREDS